MNEPTLTVEGNTLAEAEQEFENHIVSGTKHLHFAWLTLDAIRESGAWRGKVTAEGVKPSKFEEYLNDLLGCLKEKYPHLAVSRSSAFYNLKWIRRAEALDLPPGAVLAAPQTAMNMLSQMAEWDSKTGKIKKVNEDRTNVDALPGEGTPVERFQTFVGDVIHSPYSINDVSVMRKDYSDEFVYAITTFGDKITAIRVQWTKRVDGEATSAPWYDLFVDTLPMPVMKDVAGRLGTYIKDREE